MDTIHCFAPIADNHSEILILGSMPGAESLRKGQYYGHDRNSFWCVMYALFDEPYEFEYDKRTQFLLRHRIALWDVIQSCERIGSLDSNIKQPAINNFSRFFDEHKAISQVFFNGRKAYALFEKYVGFGGGDRRFEYLASTSPAHTIKFDHKVENWRKILG